MPYPKNTPKKNWVWVFGLDMGFIPKTQNNLGMKPKPIPIKPNKVGFHTQTHTQNPKNLGIKPKH